jgi:predicted MFS family arabinose efflux permease
VAYFLYTASFTVFETIGTPYTEDDFNWSVSENSILYAALGILCIFSLVILQIFVKFFQDRVLVVGATLLMVAGFLVLLDIENHLVSLPRFCIAVSLVSSGYATAVAVLISIYSKVLESLDQVCINNDLSNTCTGNANGLA